MSKIISLIIFCLSISFSQLVVNPDSVIVNSRFSLSVREDSTGNQFACFTRFGIYPIIIRNDTIYLKFSVDNFTHTDCPPDSLYGPDFTIDTLLSQGIYNIAIIKLRCAPATCGFNQYADTVYDQLTIYDLPVPVKIGYKIKNYIFRNHYLVNGRLIKN